MILVIGGTGTVGREVARGLGEEARVLTRDAMRAGAGAVVGDLTRPETLPAVFEGVKGVFLASNGPAEAEIAAIDAARAAGVRRLVKLSSMGFGPARDALTIGRWHREVESHLEKSGLEQTVLLASGFASNAFGWAETIRADRAAFAATGAGRVGVVDPRDIAEVAVKCLKEPGHAGKRYELTGPEAVSFADQISMLSDALGHPLRATEVPPDTVHAALLARGMPPFMADGLVEVMAHLRAGEAATLTSDISRLLGRAPRSFAEWARDHAAAFG